jgi:hypothetical protein
MVVFPAIAIGNTQMDNFILSVPANGYHLPVVVTGGMPPVSCVVTGNIPPGLSFNGFCAAAGAATTAGTYTFTATATDSLGNTASANITAPVPSSPVAVEQTENPNATAGWPYNWTHVLANGGVAPYTWALSAGTLPPGTTLYDFDGFATVSGVATTAGSATFSLTATDSNGNSTNPQPYIVVTNPPPSLTTSSLPAYATGSMYYASIGMSGGTPPYWCAVSGALPAGFILDAAACELYGVAAVAASFPITVTAFDSNGYGVSAPFTLSGSGISAPPNLVGSPSSLTLTAASGSSAPVPQNVQIASSGGSLAFTVAGTASWLTVNSSGGATPSTLAIQANPSGLAVGSYSGAIIVTSPGAANSPYSIPVTFTVIAAAAPGFTATANPVSSIVTQGQPATFAVTVLSQGGFSSPVTLSAINLPPGYGAATNWSPATVTPPANGQATSTLTVETTSATSTGAFNVTLQASATAFPNADAPVTLTVNPPALQIPYFTTFRYTPDPLDVNQVVTLIFRGGNFIAGTTQVWLVGPGCPGQGCQTSSLSVFNSGAMSGQITLRNAGTFTVNVMNGSGGKVISAGIVMVL